jgi:hypothetical protein
MAFLERSRFSRKIDPPAEIPEEMKSAKKEEMYKHKFTHSNGWLKINVAQ